MGGTAAVILAAGLGKRMRSSRPKVLHEVAGAPLVAWAIEAARAVPGVAPIVVVVAPAQAATIRESVGEEGIRWAVQEQPRGTADALAAGIVEVEGAPEILVLPGDAPAIRAETLRGLIEARRKAGASLAVLTAKLDVPGDLGRVVRGGPGDGVVAIVEARDASAEEREIREVNAGAYAIAAPRLAADLAAIGTGNSQGERYLTDLVRMLAGRGETVVAFRSDDPEEALGVNDRAELSRVGAVLRRRIVREHLLAGVTVVDPETTYIERDVQIGSDTVIHPFTVIRAGVRIGVGCEVGPFSHLRGGTVLEDGAAAGSFVETKKARLGERAKARHLAYIGDAVVGARANIGAGTVFANWDGKEKHESTVGEDAFIGSGTVLVAPCRVGPRGTTGAGAVLTRGREVGPGEVWVGVPARPLVRSERWGAGSSTKTARGGGTGEG